MICQQILNEKILHKLMTLLKRISNSLIHNLISGIQLLPIRYELYYICLMFTYLTYHLSVKIKILRLIEKI